MNEKPDDKNDILIIKGGSNKYNLKYKLVMLGESSVGKTCICIKQSKNVYLSDYTSTVGFDSFICDIKYKDVLLKFQIWDTAGQEKYRSIISNFYRNADLAIIVYAIDE